MLLQDFLNQKNMCGIRQNCLCLRPAFGLVRSVVAQPFAFFSSALYLASHTYPLSDGNFLLHFSTKIATQEFCDRKI